MTVTQKTLRDAGNAFHKAVTKLCPGIMKNIMYSYEQAKQTGDATHIRQARKLLIETTDAVIVLLNDMEKRVQNIGSHVRVANGDNVRSKSNNTMYASAVMSPKVAEAMAQATPMKGRLRQVKASLSSKTVTPTPTPIPRGLLQAFADLNARRARGESAAYMDVSKYVKAKGKGGGKPATKGKKPVSKGKKPVSKGKK
jgi:hypothetical protein